MNLLSAQAGLNPMVTGQSVRNDGFGTLTNQKLLLL